MRFQLSDILEHAFGCRDDNEDKVLCPACNGEYCAAGTPKVIAGNDNYAAGWGGRGDLIVIPFEGECGHFFHVCFGFHKGETTCFVEMEEMRA